MDALLWIVLGLIAGGLAMIAVHRSVPRDAWGWAGALVAGVLGSWLGGWFFGLIGLETANWVGSLVVAFVGACAILLLLRKLSPRSGDRG